MNDISRRKRRIGAAVLALALGTVACREDGVTGSTDTGALPGTTPALAVAGASKLGPDVGGLPTSGAAWDRVRSVAAGSWSAPDLCAKENKAAMQALAGALVYARTGDASYKTKVVNAINRAVGTQRDNCSSAALALGRQLGAWVMAADYVGYRDASFVKWLTQIRARNIGGHSRWFSLRVTAGNSSNNWGIWALASVIAADRYLGDASSLAQDWAIFKGYGDGSWTGFKPTSDYLAGWNCGRYRAIEDLHCGSPDHNGAPVEDASRSGSTTTPHAGYVSEAMSGLAVQAMLLARAGYDAWGVNAQQINRVALFQARFHIWNAESVVYFAAWIVNKAYGTKYPALVGNSGRMFGYTDWLYGS